MKFIIYPTLSQLPDYIRQELQSHVVEVLSRTPLRLVVAHSYDKQVMSAKMIQQHDQAKGEGRYTTIRQQIIYEGSQLALV